MSCGIYKFQNLITKEVYIGQSVNLEERYQRHQRDFITGTTDFYKGVQQWGWNNFSYEILELCSKDDLNNRESYWIDFYDSFYNGYNETKGGSNKWSVNEDDIKKLYLIGLSPKEIQNKLNIGLSTVYKYISCYPEFQATQSVNEIFQYSTQGEFIQKWASRKEAARNLHIDPAAIGKAISGERQSAGGFLWRSNYYDHIPLAEISKLKSSMAVCQYDQNLNLINTFKTAAHAARAVNGDASLIRRVCKKGLNYSAYGYKWAFMTDSNQ